MKGAHVSGMAAYEAGGRGRGRLRAATGRAWRASSCSWKTPFTRSLDDSDAPFFKWFEDGTLNVSYNCLDRQVERGLGDKVAIIFEADDGQVTRVTYTRAAGAHLPPGQCAEGARREEGRPRRHLHVDERRGRGRDAGLRAHRRDALGGVRRLLGAEPARPHRGRRRGDGRSPPTSRCAAASTLPLKAIVDEAIALGGCESVQGRDRLPAHRRQRSPGTPRATTGCTRTRAAQADTCEPEWVGAEHPLFLLYTSGSTGKPKGVQHSHAAATCCTRRSRRSGPST